MTLIHHFGANAIAVRGKMQATFYSQLSHVKDVLVFFIRFNKDYFCFGLFCSRLNGCNLVYYDYGTKIVLTSKTRWR